MARIRIYTTQVCPYCVAAKQLLKNKELDFEEIDVTHEPHIREELVSFSGGRTTVPQIFFDDTPIGGFDDLRLMNNSGELDKLLAEMQA